MTWVHWVLYNLPVSVAGLPEAVRSLPAGALEGVNDWQRTGYGGPCPPIGRHRYFHKLYALDVVLPDLGRPTRTALEQAMKGHVVAEARLVGSYQKGGSPRGSIGRFLRRSCLAARGCRGQRPGTHDFRTFPGFRAAMARPQRQLRSGHSRHMVTATFCFHEELNDFLPSEQRGREFPVPCARNATTKHMIEALGVPHTEVELILVNGQSVGFDRLLRDGDRVAVYPRFDSSTSRPCCGCAQGRCAYALRRRRPPGRTGPPAADGRFRHAFTAMTTGIARSPTSRPDSGRIVLTRDRELLKLRDITHGCYVHALKPAQQFGEIVESARSGAQPEALHAMHGLQCAVTGPIDKADIFDRLPPPSEQTSSASPPAIAAAVSSGKVRTGSG